MFNGSCKFKHLDYGIQGSKFTVVKSVLALNIICLVLVLAIVAGYAFPVLQQVQDIFGQLRFHVGVDIFRRREVPYVILSLAILAVLLKVLQKRIVEESIIVLNSLGITVRTRYALGNIKTEFLDICRIKDLIILEAVTMQMVTCYMAILLKSEEIDGEEKIHPIFLDAKLPLTTMKMVYRVAQQKLFSTDKELSS